MNILEGSELKKAQDFFKKAALIAKSSLCSVSSVGALVVKGGRVIGSAHNGPIEKACDPCLLKVVDGRARTELCYAMHAEERAIMNALENGHSTEGADLYSARTVNGEVIPYKNGLCAACGRAFLESGIKRVIMSKKDDGVVSFDANEFYDLSFDRFISKKFIM